MCVTLENFTQQHLLKLVVLVINEQKNNIKYNSLQFISVNPNM